MDKSIYLCYSPNDKFPIKSIKRCINKRKYTVLENQGIETGSQWMEHIAACIDRCDIFLFLLGNESGKSNCCIDELMYAVEKNKRILFFYPTKTAIPDAIKTVDSIELLQFTSRFDLLCSVKKSSKRIKYSIEDVVDIIKGIFILLFNLCWKFFPFVFFAIFSVAIVLNNQKKQEYITYKDYSLWSNIAEGDNFQNPDFSSHSHDSVDIAWNDFGWNNSQSVHSRKEMIMLRMADISSLLVDLYLEDSESIKSNDDDKSIKIEILEREYAELEKELNSMMDSTHSVVAYNEDTKASMIKNESDRSNNEVYRSRVEDDAIIKSIILLFCIALGLIGSVVIYPPVSKF